MSDETKQAHTPGPWEVAGHGNYVRSRSGGFAVAQSEELPGQDGEERNANARLIAAAPEMLEALKELVKEFDAYEAAMCKRFSAGHEDHGRQRELARLAIAKAEGGAS